MDDVITAIVSVIALISGLLTLVKTGLDIAKEYRASKRKVSSLLARRRFWIAMSLSLIGIAALSYSVWWSTSRDQYVVNVQIWDVELDQKHAVVASKQFRDSFRSDLPAETLQDVGNWLVEQTGQKIDFSRGEIPVHIHIPADLTNEEIQITPPGPYQLYVYLGTTRVPLNQQALVQYGEDFTLEISRPGYDGKKLFASWRQVQDENFTLHPRPIAIGIEEFTGEENNLATWLVDYLAADSRFSVRSPSTLDAIQEIGIEAIESNPSSYFALQMALGMDLIISGHLDQQ